MATRKTAPKMTKAELKQLLRRARAEAKRLLKGERDGTVTGLQLQSGLCEIQKTIEEVLPFER